MDNTIKEQLRSCKCYDDAYKIVETTNLSVSGHELLKTAFSVQERQPTVANQFISTVIQEMEDSEEKTKEVDGGVSTQSSSTTGLEKIKEPTNAAEAADEQKDKKDQMGVAINEAFPPPAQGGAGGAPPQMGAPGGVCPTCGQPPQGQQPQQQMQYTVKEIEGLKEALKAMDKKVQEAVKQQPTSLDMGDRLGGKGISSVKSMIQETDRS